MEYAIKLAKEIEEIQVEVLKSNSVNIKASGILQMKKKKDELAEYCYDNNLNYNKIVEMAKND